MAKVKLLLIDIYDICLKSNVASMLVVQLIYITNKFMKFAAVIWIYYSRGTQILQNINFMYEILVYAIQEKAVAYVYSF